VELLKNSDDILSAEHNIHLEFFWDSSGIHLEFFWNSSGILQEFFRNSSGILQEFSM